MLSGYGTALARLHSLQQMLGQIGGKTGESDLRVRPSTKRVLSKMTVSFNCDGDVDFGALQR